MFLYYGIVEVSTHFVPTALLLCNLVTLQGFLWRNPPSLHLHQHTPLAFLLEKIGKQQIDKDGIHGKIQIESVIAY